MSSKIRTLIIEDDMEAGNFLAEQIAETTSELEIIGRCETVQDAIRTIKIEAPELIFMDIVLTDGNAFEILDQFENPDFEIIFITAHSEFVEKAFRYFAFYYLNKPFGRTELESVVQNYLRKRQKYFDYFKYNILRDFIKEKGSKFLLHNGNEHILIDLNDVICCRADGNYTLFFFGKGEKIMASNPLKYYENLLCHKGFFRVNRFDLVNTAHIKAIYKKETIILSNNVKIDVPLRSRQKLKALITDMS